MFLLLVLGILYLLCLALVLIFLAGAATGSRRWENSNRSRFHSDRDHENAA